MGRVSERSCEFFAECVDDLIVYARHLAWLHAVPDAKDKKTESKISRQEQFKKAGNTVMLESPLLEHYSYIIGWLFEVGPVVNGGMGQSPLSYSDIQVWSNMVGVNVTGWEATTIRALSNAYLSEYQQAKNPNRQNPNITEWTEDDRSAVSDKIGSIFGKLVEQQERNK